ncbi:transposase [Nonomuraea bangladeshensis]|uniref:Transposase n=1 Tax=Nonomuraea bangladeshensis TaxID=404385 RepID=A0ABV3H853_9ACTN
MHVHLVFVTKYRRNVFNEEMLRHGEEIMNEGCDSYIEQQRRPTWPASGSAPRAPEIHGDGVNMSHTRID